MSLYKESSRDNRISEDGWAITGIKVIRLRNLEEDSVGPRKFGGPWISVKSCVKYAAVTIQDGGAKKAKNSFGEYNLSISRSF